ncbi:glycosyltransferase [Microbispora bryophytorum]|uniref:glycosyltransferase n=1 Tax=Microbispora bryophytorum TaxID=1460882 RepID=UPI00295E45A6|nr:glycosyltransferase [Microbispora camponoti]
MAGTDLLPTFAATAPLDVFGMKVTNLPAKLGLTGEMETFEDLPQAAMHAELARRRVYLHPYRWTSLGLSLIEAMMIGMPVVALATTEAVEAVPPEAGIVSTKLPTLLRALHQFANEPELAVQRARPPARPPWPATTSTASSPPGTHCSTPSSPDDPTALTPGSGHVGGSRRFAARVSRSCRYPWSAEGRREPLVKSGSRRPRCSPIRSVAKTQTILPDQFFAAVL